MFLALQQSFHHLCHHSHVFEQMFQQPNDYIDLRNDKLDRGNEAIAFTDDEVSLPLVTLFQIAFSSPAVGPLAKAAFLVQSGSNSSSSSESFETTPALESNDNSSAAFQGSKVTNQSDATQPATIIALFASDTRSKRMANSVEIEKFDSKPYDDDAFSSTGGRNGQQCQPTP